MSTKFLIQKTLTEAAGLSVQFHAYYWGKFEFTEAIKTDDFTFFAKAASTALAHRLSYKGERIFLHTGQNPPLLLAEDLQVFFQNATNFNQQIIYDARPSYEGLFTKAQMYVSDFNDPEDFEEIEAYLMLIKGIDKHFNKMLNIQNIQGKEVGDLKQIEIHLKEAKYDITLHKELFDVELLNSLNDILERQLALQETLHLSIDSKMRMIILKLDSASLEEATRMGLII